MNKNKILLALMAVLIFTMSCEDEDRLPLVVLDTVAKGAYPRLIDETDKLINLFDVAGSTYSYNIEFVDETGGTLVAEYVVDLFYDDNDPSNGDNSVGPIEFIKMTPDMFTTNENGFLQAPTININGADAFQMAGVSIDDVTAGDNFNFVGRIVLTDGRIFSQTNSSATVVGPAFRGHFNFTMPANCPSDLTGTYNYTTTAVWCDDWDGTDLTGTVDIIAAGGGSYYFSDWSFGAYGPCYGGIASQPGLQFAEVCAEVGFTGFMDSFGDTWTYDASIDGEEWTINWSNTFNESASSVITFPGGVPFTLE